MKIKNKAGFIAALLLTPVIIAVVVLIIIIGVFVASRKAAPGQFLYPVKQAGDQVELWLTFGHQAKAEVRLKLAERYTKEIIDETKDNDFNEVVDESKEFREKIQNAKKDVKEITETGKNIETLQSEMQTLAQNEIIALNEALNKTTGKEKDAIGNEIILTEQLMLN